MLFYLNFHSSRTVLNGSRIGHHMPELQGYFHFLMLLFLCWFEIQTLGLKAIVAVTTKALASPTHLTSSCNSPASTSDKLTFVSITIVSSVH